MEYLTHEELETLVKDKDKITVDDFIYILEEKLDYAVSLEKKPQLTDAQRKRVTDFVFSNKDILEQLRTASKRQNYIYDDEEAIKIIKEARDGEK